MEKQKLSLLDAYTKKGTAIAKLSIIEDNTAQRMSEIDEIFGEIAKFVDVGDMKVRVLFVLFCFKKH